MRHLNTFAMILFPVGLLAACSPDMSSTNQLITCDTDPGTGVILSCVPGGDQDGGNDPDTCVDVDEDGDGEPGDQSPGQIARTSGAVTGEGSGGDNDDVDDDRDDDGISDELDCDEHEGEDDDDNDVDLPYDVRPQLGDPTTPIADAFAEKGAQPTSILSVTMDGGGTWRLDDLRAGTSFVVTQADCDHEGNRDTGRDRVVVTWTNFDGSTQSDHLDIRYCNP